MSTEFKRAIWLCFQDFCKYNTLHGVRYFTVPVRHWTERLWWAISVALALCLSIWMIYPFWVEWQTYPMIMTTTDEANAVSQIPFPTVVFCPSTKIMQNKFDVSSKFDSKYRLLPNVSHADQMRMLKLVNACPVLRKILPYKNDFADEDIFNVIEDVAPNVGHVTLSCAWKGAIINCSEYLEPTLTHLGICFTFNGFNSRDIYTDEMAPGAMISKKNPSVAHWSIENGYEHEFGKEEYPIRVTGPDQIATLEINFVIDERDHNFRLCQVGAPGFLLYLTTPYEPNTLLAKDPFDAAFSRDTHIEVASTLTTTSDGLRKYSPERRECFFQSERQLRFYKTYSRSDCEMECWANLTKEHCGCVDISMPRDKETKICGAKRLLCFVNVLPKFNEFVRNECNCKRACTSMEYHPRKIEQLPLNINDSKQLNEGQQRARLRISFQNLQVKTMQRVETVTVIDFLAMCGGVLGLFMGFSVMTIVEYIYYPFLRLYCTIQRVREDEEEKSKGGANANKKKSADTGIRTHSRQWKNRLKNYLLEYCDNSSIHGMRYFSLPGLHRSERYFWAIFCVASFSLCGWMTYNVWVQWQLNPVVIKLDREYASLEMTPYPTVTICPEVKTTKRKLDLTSALDNLPNLSHIETQRLNALTNVCPLLPNWVAFGDRFANESIYDTIQDIAPQFDDTFVKCSFMGGEWQGCSSMTSIITDEGLCFAFNAADSHEMYTNEMAAGMLIVKQPTLALSAKMPLSAIILSADIRNNFHQCKHFDGIFKVILTQHGEVIKMARNALRIHPSKRNIISCETKMMRTSEGLRSYTPNQRRCFFESERPLRFFKMYTKTNCEEECLANFTSAECGCVHFSMPRDNKTRVCSGASISCLKAAKRKLLTDESGMEYHSKCNCLPACSSVEYKTEIQPINWNIDKRDFKKGENLASVFLVFKNAEAFERVERFTVIDFLANCGGLLGECMGISVLSLVEIIFFVTLRLFFVIRSWIFQNTAVHPMNEESVETVTESTAVRTTDQESIEMATEKTAARPTNQESIEMVTIEHLDE